MSENPVFTGTTIKLRLETELEIVAYTDLFIRYRKPSGDKGQWEATLEGTELVYNTSRDDLDEVGLWRFQAVVEVGDEIWKGEIVTLDIRKPIRV